MDPWRSLDGRRQFLPGVVPWHCVFLALSAGVFGARSPLAAATGMGLLWAVARGQDKRAHLGGWLCVFVLGGLVGILLLPRQPSRGLPDWMAARKTVELRGTVDTVAFKPEQRAKIILTDVQVRPSPGAPWQQWSASVVWTWEHPSAWPGPGQRVRLQSRLKPVHGFANTGTWNTEAYWARRNVWYRTYTKGEDGAITLTGKPSPGWHFRLALRQRIVELTPPGPGRGLALSLLMGDRSELSYATLDLVRRGSLAHSLALSGLHVGFIVSIGFALAWGLGWIVPGVYLRLPRSKLAVLLCVPLVSGYLWLGQAAPSLIRASVMFGAWGVLLWKGRAQVLLDGLFWAVLVLFCLSPLSVYDIGVQLSVVAVAGLILLGRALGPLWRSAAASWPAWLAPLRYALAVLGMSFLANLVLLPLLASTFGVISPHLYLNSLWLPLLGLGVLPLALVGVLGWVVPHAEVLSVVGFKSAAILADRMIAGLQWLDGHGWLEDLTVLRPWWPEAFGYWLLLGALVLGLCARKRIWPLVGVGLMLLVLPSLWQGTHHGHVQMAVLDVGQGQAILLQGPTGRRVLVDGGGSWNPDFDLARFAVLPPLTWGDGPALEYAVLTHPDFDHHRGLITVAQCCQVNRFVFNGDWPKGRDGKELEEALQSREVGVSVVSRGETIPLGGSCCLEVLHPPRQWGASGKNDRSLVLRLCAEGRGLALLCGDIEKNGLTTLLQNTAGLRSEVLVVPHHGSRSSVSPDLYAAVEPDLAVVSAGFLHPFRFPHQEVLTALAAQDIPVETTARAGAVRIDWDLTTGRRKVERFRDRL